MVRIGNRASTIGQEAPFVVGDGRILEYGGQGHDPGRSMGTLLTKRNKFDCFGCKNIFFLCTARSEVTT